MEITRLPRPDVMSPPPRHHVAAPERADGPGAPDPTGAALGFRVDRRAPGVNVIRLVDLGTGDVVLQMPPEGVLHQVSEIIDTMRRREV